MIIPEKIKGLMQKLLDNNFEAYIIGGACRDSYYGMLPNDYDIFTNATGKQILKMFPTGKILGGEERQKKILTIIANGVEISQYRSSGDRTETGNTLPDHQATCDFYINALAVDIKGRYCGDGKITQRAFLDLDERKLNFVGDAQTRINEDLLRILRGIRFMLKYNLTTDEKTMKLLKYTNLNSLPVDRIRDELLKIFRIDLQKGFLKHLLNFLPIEINGDNMHKTGGKYHNETPYEHSEDACLNACKYTNNSLLRIALLLHDIGKEIDRTEDDEVHFYGHHKSSAEIVEKWMKRLKFSNSDIKYVTTLIYNHMHGYIDVEPTKKSYVKLFNRFDEAKIKISDYILLHYCDHMANNLKPRIKFNDYIKDNKYFEKYYKLKFSSTPFNVKDLEISGHDVMAHGIKGKQIGIELNKLFDLVMDGKLENNRINLLKQLKRNLK